MIIIIWYYVFHNVPVSDLLCLLSFDFIMDRHRVDHKMHCPIVVLVCSILALSVNSAILAGPTVALPRTEALEPIESSSKHSQIDSNVLSEPVQPTTLNSSQSNLCMTKGCVKTSAQILDLIDDNVDPCDNFYEFACGKFLRNTLIPDDKIAVMSFIHVQDKVQDQVRLVLSERSLPNESKPFTLAKILYAACMDLDILEAQGMYLISNV